MIQLFRTVVLQLCLLLAVAAANAAAAATPLVLDGRADIDAWPAVTLWLGAEPSVAVEEAVAHPERFDKPHGTPGNLGRATQTVWLRIPVRVPGHVPAERVFEIDYPSLNRIDLYVLQQGRVEQHFEMGNQLPLAARAQPTRTHAAVLKLAPGEHELLVRVHTLSSMVLPITLRTPQSFTAHESHMQIVQGILIGLTLCMLMYSLAHWVSLRDRVFLDYALLLGGNTVFSLAYFGIGAQYLWPDSPGLSTRIAPMALLVAVAFGTQFTRTTLAVHEVSRSVDMVLRVAGALALAVLAGALLNLLDYPTVQSLVTALGLIATLVMIPVAFVRARRGERVAAYMLGGWVVFLAGALVAAGILRGLIVPGFWTQHVYPFSSLVEMVAWMAVLGLRVQNIHLSADRARVESDAMRTLAQTDPLTGLPNRRGLQARIDTALQHCAPQRLLAVYLLDLDGFKPVNDLWGHDVGDALLVAVGQRLQAQVRGSDVVARLGGDEFVVLANGLTDEAAAHVLGQKLLAAFKDPFDAAGQRCGVGLTVGYALAPLDGDTAGELLKRADTAMYAGKQAGRGRAQRGGRSLVSV